MNEKNKLGYVPINKLIITTGLPIVLSMMLQSVYNIVDSMFVSNMAENGEAALNALTLAFPVQLLLVAFGIGTGVGVNTLLARYLGQKDYEKVNQTAGNGIFLGIVIYILFLLFGIFGVRLYVASQTSNPLILDMSVKYLRICCVFGFGVSVYGICEKLLQATGRSMYSTIAQVAGAVINIILDPILIYGLLGFPKMGVVGAAIATVAGQIGSMLIALYFHFKFNEEIKNGVKYMKPSKDIILKIYAIGIPAIVAQMLVSLMTYGLNIIFIRINENVVTAYGLFYKIQQFILYAAFGLRDAVTPIIAYNYGMSDKKRVNEGVKYGLIYTVALMIFGMLIVECFAAPLSSIFGLSGETMELCIYAMRIVSISFVFAGLNIMFQGIFQALEEGGFSLIISICRQLIFVLPVAWFFSNYAIKSMDHMWMVWSTFIIAEVLTMLIGIYMVKQTRKRKIEMISEK